MHITHLQLINFKRFTDLTIDLSKLTTPPKLVLLIGANGSGKSSIFDAFESLSVYAKAVSFIEDFPNYCRKDTERPVKITANFSNHTTLIVGSDETHLLIFVMKQSGRPLSMGEVLSAKYLG
ncbi:MAG: AAA family ATPase [Tunicatimonas sp.]|uniref:AAA family ATPase n=1 Tax=Tunicatimonas sp. TaxID=1940096 RepID=UPI003C789011